MKPVPTRLASALAVAALFAGAATSAHAAPELKFGGFGTVSAVHSNNRDADFVGSIAQNSGAGYTHPWSFGPDSKLGVQADVAFNSQFSAVVQVVSQHQYDDSWKPMVEWANVKYQVTPEWSVQLGRIALPTNLVSDSRFVGYANTWVRPPLELYGMQSITSNDGINVVWQRDLGGVHNRLQGYYGRSKVDTAGNTTVKSNPSWGLVDAAQIGDLTLRAGYNSYQLTVDSPGLNGLIGAYAAFSAFPGPIGAAAASLAQKYKLDDMSLRVATLAASYDPGDWFVTAEFADSRGDGLLGKLNGWYVSGGYRIGAFTPYITYAGSKAHMEDEAGLGIPQSLPLDMGLNIAKRSTVAPQRTTSLGLRWDFRANMALKAQYDSIDLDAGYTGRFVNVQPGFQPGSTVNLFTVALDFVF